MQELRGVIQEEVSKTLQTREERAREQANIAAAAREKVRAELRAEWRQPGLYASDLGGLRTAPQTPEVGGYRVEPVPNQYASATYGTYQPVASAAPAQQ